MCFIPRWIAASSFTIGFLYRKKSPAGTRRGFLLFSEEISDGGRSGAEGVFRLGEADAARLRRSGVAICV